MVKRKLRNEGKKRKPEEVAEEKPKIEEKKEDISDEAIIKRDTGGLTKPGGDVDLRVVSKEEAFKTAAEFLENMCLLTEAFY